MAIGNTVPMKRTALFARSICIQTLQNDLLIFCCLDMGCITYAMRSLAIQRLQGKLGSRFQAQRFILMATTHILHQVVVPMKLYIICQPLGLFLNIYKWWSMPLLVVY